MLKPCISGLSNPSLSANLSNYLSTGDGKSTLSCCHTLIPCSLLPVVEVVVVVEILVVVEVVLVLVVVVVVVVVEVVAVAVVVVVVAHSTSNLKKHRREHFRGSPEFPNQNLSRIVNGVPKL